MSIRAIPEGYHTVTPYLTVRGIPNMITFLKLAFNAEELRRTVRDDGTIMNTDIKIGTSIIMLSEAVGDTVPMTGAFYLYSENVDETHKKALDAGGVSIMEPEYQFYGDRNSGIKDPSGNIWWIATHIEDVSEEEIQRRLSSRTKVTSVNEAV